MYILHKINCPPPPPPYNFIPRREENVFSRYLLFILSTYFFIPIFLVFFHQGGGNDGKKFSLPTLYFFIYTLPPHPINPGIPLVLRYFRKYLFRFTIEFTRGRSRTSVSTARRSSARRVFLTDISG